LLHSAILFSLFDPSGPFLGAAKRAIALGGKEWQKI